MPKKLVHHIGQEFSLLTTVSYVGRGRWFCQCKCGGTTTATTNDLTTGHTRSCGCLLRDMRKRGLNIIHGCTVGDKWTREYRAWSAAKERCFYVKNKYYKDYGGRGITMCQEWRNDFRAFFKAVGECPLGMSLDRFPDHDGNYEPGNVRWATPKEQGRNKRNNHWVSWCGQTLTIAGWSEQLGFPREILYKRIVRDHWSIEKALTTPLRLS